MASLMMGPHIFKGYADTLMVVRTVQITSLLYGECGEMNILTYGCKLIMKYQHVRLHAVVKTVIRVKHSTSKIGHFASLETFSVLSVLCVYEHVGLICILMVESSSMG